MSFKYMKIKGGIKLTEYLGEKEVVKIPGSINGNSVRAIGSNCFFSKNNLEKVILPNSIREVEIASFTNCENLKEVEVNSTLEIDNIFLDCNEEITIISNLKRPVNFETGQSLGFDTNIKIVDINNFEYEIISEEKKTAKLVKYSGKNKWVKIPDIINGYKIVEINEGMFFRNNTIRHIEFPKYLKEIPNRCCEYSTMLMKVKLKNNIIKIGEFAFSGCISLEEINFPDSLEVISKGAFSYTTMLREIKLPKGLKEIEKRAFQSSGLFEFSLPSTIKKLGDYAFCATNVESINIPKDITEIPEGLFYRCTMLKNVTLDGFVDYIGEEAFCETSISEFDFTKVKKIGNMSFSRTSFREIYIPENLELGIGSFVRARDLATIVFDENYKKNIPRISFSECSNLKTVIFSDHIKKLGEDAFGETAIESITLPRNLEEIGTACFRWCRNLKTVKNYDDSKLVKIGEEAFCFCNKLSEFNFNNNLLKIEDSAFIMTSLEEVNLNNLKSLGRAVFSHCSKLKEVHLPNYLEKIKDKTFSNCYSLEKVIVGKGLKEIGEHAFSECTFLKKIDVGDKLEKIGHCAFQGCIALKEIDLPESLETIERFCFCGCKSLEDIYIGKNLKEISDSAFGNTGLKEVYIPPNIEHIGKEAFCFCEDLKRVQIDGNIKELSVKLFNGCISLEELILPESLEELRYGSLNRVGLKELHFKNVKIIDRFSILYCSSLEKVTIENVEDIGVSNFEDCLNLKKIEIDSSLLVNRLRGRSYFKKNKDKIKIRKI